MAYSVMDQIERKSPEFSKGQRRIAAYVSEHFDEAAYMTAARLGAVTGVSEPTVVRFACTLGYEGYPEFLRALNEYAKARLTAVQRVEVSSKLLNHEDVLASVMTMDAECVRKSINTVDRADFSGAVQAILNAESVYILGVRSASALSTFLYCYLSLFFKNVKLVNSFSASEMFEQIYKLDSSDAIIGISFPRYSQRTVKALRFAHGRGAKVISITDSEQSPLVPFSDFKLLARCEIISYVDSLVAPLSIINALLVALSMAKKDELDNTLRGLEDIWDEYNVYEKSPENESL